MAKTANMSREVYEGWTVWDFIVQLQPQLDVIMSGQSWLKPFTTKKALCDWLKANQPYYKKSIPEVNSYFVQRYNLK